MHCIGECFKFIVIYVAHKYRMMKNVITSVSVTSVSLHDETVSQQHKRISYLGR